RASVLLGAGRAQADDEIDYAVGFSQIKKVGERVETGEPLLFIHAREDHALESVLPLLQQACEIA
ncbi:MAG: pyrimidine-nucleoside phosphorylase, partial [Chthoniobacterales bacterium]|nr:pyrimidine-nucleoside phosphorylase [Chthoniobacterales bacterium]